VREPMEKNPLLAKLDVPKICGNIIGWSDLNSDDVHVHEFCCLTNKVYGLTNQKLAKEGDGPDQEKTGPLPRKVIYRMFGTMKVPLLDRKIENEIMQKLGEIGLAPAIYYSDKEIRIEEFIYGREVNDTDKTSRELHVSVACFMAKFHNLFREDSGIRSVHKKWMMKRVVDDKFLIDYISALDKFKDRTIETKTTQFLKKYVTPFELSFLKESLQQLCQEPKNDVICHNDIHWGNILYVESTKSYFVIDYEYANSNPRAYDIANFFNEMIYTYGEAESPYFTYDTERFPKDNFIYEFLMYYCFFAHCSRDMSNFRDVASQTFDDFVLMCKARNIFDVLDAEANSLLREVYILAMFANYYWILVFILAYNDNEYQIDPEVYIDSRVECYEFFKKKIAAFDAKKDI